MLEVFYKNPSLEFTRCGFAPKKRRLNIGSLKRQQKEKLPGNQERGVAQHLSCVPSDVEPLQYVDAFGWWELFFIFTLNKISESFFQDREESQPCHLRPEPLKKTDRLMLDTRR